MNLERAFVLLFASIGAVAGFAPSAPAAFSVAPSRATIVPKVRIPSPLSSEVEDAVEASDSASEEEQPVEPAFDKTIYIGNISFGEFDTERCTSATVTPLRHHPTTYTFCCSGEHGSVELQMLPRVISGLSLPHTERLPSSKCLSTGKR